MSKAKKVEGRVKLYVDGKLVKVKSRIVVVHDIEGLDEDSDATWAMHYTMTPDGTDIELVDEDGEVVNAQTTAQHYSLASDLYYESDRFQNTKEVK